MSSGLEWAQEQTPCSRQENPKCVKRLVFGLSLRDPRFGPPGHRGGVVTKQATQLDLPRSTTGLGQRAQVEDGRTPLEWARPARPALGLGRSGEAREGRSVAVDGTGAAGSEGRFHAWAPGSRPVPSPLRVSVS